MKLFDGFERKAYFVKNVNLPVSINKRLEALGMVSGTKLNILNKRKTAVVIIIRGTRFALGKTIAQNIEIAENGGVPGKNGG